MTSPANAYDETIKDFIGDFIDLTTDVRMEIYDKIMDDNNNANERVTKGIKNVIKYIEELIEIKKMEKSTLLELKINKLATYFKKHIEIFEIFKKPFDAYITADYSSATGVNVIPLMQESVKEYKQLLNGTDPRQFNTVPNEKEEKELEELPSVFGTSTSPPPASSPSIFTEEELRRHMQLAKHAKTVLHNPHLGDMPKELRRHMQLAKHAKTVLHTPHLGDMPEEFSRGSRTLPVAPAHPTKYGTITYGTVTNDAAGGGKRKSRRARTLKKRKQRRTRRRVQNRK